MLLRSRCSVIFIFRLPPRNALSRTFVTALVSIKHIMFCYNMLYYILTFYPKQWKLFLSISIEEPQFPCHWHVHSTIQFHYRTFNDPGATNHPLRSPLRLQPPPRCASFFAPSSAQSNYCMYLVNYGTCIHCATSKLQYITLVLYTTIHYFSTNSNSTLYKPPPVPCASVSSALSTRSLAYVVVAFRGSVILK